MPGMGRRNRRRGRTRGSPEFTLEHQGEHEREEELSPSAVLGGEQRGALFVPSYAVRVTGEIVQSILSVLGGATPQPPRIH